MTLQIVVFGCHNYTIKTVQESSPFGYGYELALRPGLSPVERRMCIWLKSNAAHSGQAPSQDRKVFVFHHTLGPGPSRSAENAGNQWEPPLPGGSFLCTDSHESYKSFLKIYSSEMS